MSQLTCKICGKLITHTVNYERHIKSCLIIHNQTRSDSIGPTSIKRAPIKKSNHTIKNATSMFSESKKKISRTVMCKDIDICYKDNQGTVLNMRSRTSQSVGAKSVGKIPSHSLMKGINMKEQYDISMTNDNIKCCKTRRQFSQIRTAASESENLPVTNIARRLRTLSDAKPKVFDVNIVKKESRIRKSSGTRKSKDCDLNMQSVPATMISRRSTSVTPEICDNDIYHDLTNMKTRRLRSSFVKEEVFNVNKWMNHLATKEEPSTKEQIDKSISIVKTRKQKSLCIEPSTENTNIELGSELKKRSEAKSLKRKESCVSKEDHLTAEVVKILGEKKTIEMLPIADDEIFPTSLNRMTRRNSIYTDRPNGDLGTKKDAKSIMDTPNKNCFTRLQKSLFIESSIGDNNMENKIVTKTVIGCDIEPINKKSITRRKTSLCIKRFSENDSFDANILTNKDKNICVNEIFCLETDPINIDRKTRNQKSMYVTRLTENNNLEENIFANENEKKYVDTIFDLDIDTIDPNEITSQQKSLSIKNDIIQTNNVIKENERTHLNGTNVFDLGHKNKKSILGLRHSLRRASTGVKTRLSEQMDNYVSNVVEYDKLLSESTTEMEGKSAIVMSDITDSSNIHRSSSTRDNKTTQVVSKKRKRTRNVNIDSVNSNNSPSFSNKDISTANLLFQGDQIDATSFKSPDCMNDDTCALGALMTTEDADIAVSLRVSKSASQDYSAATVSQKEEKTDVIGVPGDLNIDDVRLKSNNKSRHRKSRSKKCKVKAGKKMVSLNFSETEIVSASIETGLLVLSETSCCDTVNIVEESVPDMLALHEKISATVCDLSNTAGEVCGGDTETNLTVTVPSQSADMDKTPASNIFHRNRAEVITENLSKDVYVMTKEAIVITPYECINGNVTDISEDNLFIMNSDCDGVIVEDMSSVILENSEEMTTAPVNYTLNSDDIEEDLFTVDLEKSNVKKTDTPSENLNGGEFVHGHSCAILSENCKEITMDKLFNKGNRDGIIEKDLYADVAGKIGEMTSCIIADEELWAAISGESEKIMVDDNSSTVISEKDDEKKADITPENIGMTAEESCNDKNDEHNPEEFFVAVITEKCEEMMEDVSYANLKCEDGTEMVLSTGVAENNEESMADSNDIHKEDLPMIIIGEEITSYGIIEGWFDEDLSVVVPMKDLSIVISENSEESLTLGATTLITPESDETDLNVEHGCAISVISDEKLLAMEVLNTEGPIMSPRISDGNDENTFSAMVTASDEMKSDAPPDTFDCPSVGDAEGEDTKQIAPSIVIDDYSRTTANLEVEEGSKVAQLEAHNCGAIDSTECLVPSLIQNAEERDYDVMACTTSKFETTCQPCPKSLSNIPVFRRKSKSLDGILDKDARSGDRGSLKAPNAMIERQCIMDASCKYRAQDSEDIKRHFEQCHGSKSPGETESESAGSSVPMTGSPSFDSDCMITDVELGLSAVKLNLPNDETNRKKLYNIYRQLMSGRLAEGAIPDRSDNAPSHKTAAGANEKRVAVKRKHEEYRTDETDRASRQHDSLFKCEICLETVDSRNQLETHRLLHSMDGSYTASKLQSSHLGGVSEGGKQNPRIKRPRPQQEPSETAVEPKSKKRRCDKCLKVAFSEHKCAVREQEEARKAAAEEARMAAAEACDGRFVCPHCAERPSFTDRDCYLIHVMCQCRAVKEKQEKLLEKHFPSQYGCGTCGLMFKTSTRLNTHKESAHRPKQLLAH